jgi:hypothetical protein
MISVHIDGLHNVLRDLRTMPSKIGRGTGIAMRTIGFKVQAESKANCPESPTKAQINASLKRNKKSIRDSTTGALRDSIRFDAKEDYVDILVPQNSKGGQYAMVIHDMKGSAWRKRGVRTRQKGSRADDKFIERARDDAVKSGFVERALIAGLKQAGA